MPPTKVKKTEGNVISHCKRKGMKKCKRSIIAGAKMSINPNFSHQVMTRSRLKLLNQIKDKCLKSDLSNMNNEFSFSHKRKRKIKAIDLVVSGTEATKTISDNVMEINSVDNNIESIVLPSTSSQQTNVPPKTSDTTEVTNENNFSHSEKMEINENIFTNEPPSVLDISKITEDISKINNEPESNLEQIINSASKSPNNSDDKENEMKTAIIEEVRKDMISFMTQEIWKKKQLYYLQKDIIEMENKKLNTFKKLFEKCYDQK